MPASLRNRSHSSTVRACSFSLISSCEDQSIRVAIAVGLEPRIVQPLLAVEQLTELASVCPRWRRGEVAILGPEYAIRRVDRVVISGRGRHAAAIQVAHRLEPHRPHHRLEQRGVDHLAASRPLPRLERRQDAVRAVEPGEQIGDRDADAHRLASLESGHAHQSGERPG